MTIQDVVCQQADFISIHTALAGCDLTALETKLVPGIFQSTQPSQAVTRMLEDNRIIDFISIHTALAGCDGGDD